MSDDNMAHNESSLGSTRVVYKETNRQTRVQKQIVDILLRELRSLKLRATHIQCEQLITVLAMFIRTSSHCFLVQMSSCFSSVKLGRERNPRFPTSKVIHCVYCHQFTP